MSSIFAPFTPNHVNLINACYPTSAALVASGSDCQPLSQELSRLTYYASNKAGKLAKLGAELEKRALAEARKARSGHARPRAQLLVTMAIFKALSNECKRDVALFTKMLLNSVKEGSSCLPADLEVQARVASAFTAWVTYTDGHPIGVDNRITLDYLAILKWYSQRILFTGKDTEYVNRMRLIGIATVSASLASDAFYVTPDEFKRQTGIVVPALLGCLHEVGTATLTDESLAMRTDPYPTSPYLSEFQPRPLAERRAASIHLHIDGQQGPEEHDVVNACLRALRTLLGRCNTAQVAWVVETFLQTIDGAKSWGDRALCKWYAERLTEWTQYQYRFAVPTKLVDRLLAQQDWSTSTSHFAIIEMIMAVFKSPSPLINLSTSDIISNLITVLLRRVSLGSDEALLTALVDCIASLGTHIYYADQIHDQAEEIISRIVNVQVNGVLGRGRGGGEKARETALKCLVACLSGLLEAADRNTSKAGVTPSETEGDIQDEGTVRASSAGTSATRTGRRNKVSPETWQETLALLCESDYGIRATYAQSLTAFLQLELKRERFVKDEQQTLGSSDATKTRIVVDPDFKASTRPSILAADPISRFLNALNATTFTLMTSSAMHVQLDETALEQTAVVSANITIVPPSTPNLPLDEGRMNGHSAMSTPASVAEQLPSSSTSPSVGAHDPSTAGTGSKRSRGHGGRKLSIALSLLDGTNHVPTTLSDFSLVYQVLVCAQRQVPCRALMTGVPMLLALDALVKQGNGPGSRFPPPLTRAIGELTCHVWIAVGQIWECPSIVDMASKALGEPEQRIVPEVNLGKRLHPSAIGPSVEMPSDVDGSHADHALDCEAFMDELASKSALQTITGLTREELLHRFSLEWTSELALKESVEHVSSHDIYRGDMPHLKLSPALMHIENMSLASLARSTTGVGVGDLREALGRGGVSTPALVSATSFSTVGRAASLSHRLDRASNPEHPALSRIKSHTGKPAPNEVRDMLNKLGIGKQNQSNTLKAPFLPKQSQDTIRSKGTTSALVNPPY